MWFDLGGDASLVVEVVTVRVVTETIIIITKSFTYHMYFINLRAVTSKET